MTMLTTLPRPRSRHVDVLYLDYDGVLHPQDVRGAWGIQPRLGPELALGHQLFEHAAQLAARLEPYGNVRIVLSTAWVRVKGYGKTVKRLPPSLVARCCGATWHKEMRPLECVWQDLPRGRQVLEDVERRQPRRWLALDDDPTGWSPFEARLVLADPLHGIGHPRVREEL